MSTLKTILSASAAAIVAVAIFSLASLPSQAKDVEVLSEIVGSFNRIAEASFQPACKIVHSGRYEISGEGGEYLSVDGGLGFSRCLDKQPPEWEVLLSGEGSSFSLLSGESGVGIVGDGEIGLVRRDEAASWSIMVLSSGVFAVSRENGISLSGETPLSFFDLDVMDARISEMARSNRGCLDENPCRMVTGGMFLSDEEGVLSISEAQISKGSFWTVVWDDAGFAEIENDESELVLECEGAFDRSPVFEASASDSTRQDWILIPEGDGFKVMPRGREGMWLSVGDDGTPMLSDIPSVWVFEGKDIFQEEKAMAFAQIAIDEYKGGEAAGDYHKGGEKYWGCFQSSYEAWCSEFAGWCLVKAGLVPGKTMPSDPTYANAFLSFYRDHPEYGTVHENDGSYVPQVGDICLHGDLGARPEHSDLIAEVDGVGGYRGVSGNSGDRVKMKSWTTASEDSVAYYVTIDWEVALSASQ